MRKLPIFLLGAGILGAGAAVGVYFMKNKPKAERRMRVRLTPIVECADLTKGERRIRLELLGQIIPARQVVLQSRVGGEIVGVHTNWIEGGLVAEGEVLVRIDVDDYRIALTQAESELALAESDAQLEKGRKDVALEEWRMLGGSIEAGDEDKALALRVPQEQAAAARVKAAKARVSRAWLDLERTRIKAPFNLAIVQRHANVGDQASVQSKLAAVVDTDRYRVLVSVPVDELKWVLFPADGTAGSSAEVRLPSGGTCPGRVIRRLPDVERNGRMARLLVEIEAPLARDVPLLLNSFVGVHVDGRSVRDAYAIDRTAFRDNSRIWLISAANTLRILPVEPLWTSVGQVVFRADVRAGERLITSDLGVAIDGMELRVAGEGGEKPGRRPGRGGKAGGRSGANE